MTDEPKNETPQVDEAAEAVESESAAQDVRSQAEPVEAPPENAAAEAPASEREASAEGDADADEAAQDSAAEVAAEAPVESAEPSNPNFNWYVLRVQTGRENSVKESVDRRVKMEGMEAYFGRVMVPTEQVSEIRDGKKRVSNRKTYAGYIFIEMEMTDEAQHLVNETPGVAGFVGVDRRTRTKPVPMRTSEVEKMLNQVETTEEEQPKVDIRFKVGESVKVKEGPFENFDGVVEEINPAKGTVKVVVTIFGRPTPYELEYWQIESN